MNNTKRALLLAVTMLLLSVTMLSNSMSPRMACLKKAKGDSCSSTYGCASGTCVSASSLDPQDKKAGKAETLVCKQ